jgi:hypothetical protein
MSEETKGSPLKKPVSEKRTYTIVFAVIAGMIIASILSLIFILTHGSEAYIFAKDGSVFRAHFSIVGNHIIITSRSAPEKDIKNALNSPLAAGISIISADSVTSIEFMHNTTPTEEEPHLVLDPNKKKSGPFTVLGTYTVNVSGHRGKMVIISQKGGFEGYIQFPNWAKGMREPMKKIKIHGNTISFTRSVETAAEQKRVGAPNLFVQNFAGEISDGGKTIKGFFTNHGGKEIWEAVRK